MADAVDMREAAPAPPQSKASMPEVCHGDAPTEPATSPRVREVPVVRCIEELRLPGLEHGPQPEPEKFASRWVVNDGSYTHGEWQEYLRKHRQTWSNRDMERERQQAEAAEYEAHQRSIQEWEAQVKAAELHHSAIPSGPAPDGISSMRALPQVHDVMHYVRMIQRCLHILSLSSRRLHHLWDVLDLRSSVLMQNLHGLVHQCNLHHLQHSDPQNFQGLNLPLAATPMTPSHPPRPPIEALPKHPSMETSTGVNKHPLELPAAQGPPSKHVRSKAFPYDSQPPDQVYVAASAAVQMPQPSRPCPKGPPESMMPTPPEVMSMQPACAIDDKLARMNSDGKYVKIKSVRDIDWGRPLWEQLAAVLKGGPDPSKSFDELCRIRSVLPRLANHELEGIFPADNVITVVQKNHGVHKIHMREVAAWVLNGTHWFGLLQQPMMIIVWCHDWEDASKFQYLMQILQAHFGDFVPRYQIFMFDDSKIYGRILQWQEPTTVWDGKPVLGFMAETFLDDLSVIGFKDFNPMWTFPTTSVNQCWEPMTFGMPPWHLSDEVQADKQKSKEALQSQSPIAAFKACNMLQALGIAYSKIVLPSGDSKGEAKQRTYCPTTWSHCYQWEYAGTVCRSIERSQSKSIVMQRVHTSSAHSIEQQECESSRLCICRLREHYNVWRYDQSHSMHRFQDYKRL